MEVVLSLFDGVSCGQQALNRIGIKPKKYYASEIDKYAIKVTQHNYPDTIQLGSVVDVDVSKLDKIDLLIGGSPCQSFSFAGKRKGMSTKDNIEILTIEHYLELKEQNFEFEGQSYLFWEYMRVLTDIRKYNPDVKFLLENVIMGEKWQKILTRAIGINPIEINSALVSAQNRRRLYWTNIGAEQDGLFGDLKCMIPQPKDKGILLKDVLNSEVDEKYYLSNKMLDYFNRNDIDCKEKGTGFRFTPEKEFDVKSKTVTSKEGTQMQNNYIVHNTMPRSSKTGKGGTGPLSRNDGKTYCLDTGQTNAVEIVAMRGRTENKGEDWHHSNHVQKLETRNDGKTNSITGVQKDNLVRFNNKRLNKTIDTHSENIIDGTMLDSYNNSIHQDKSITVSTRIKDSNCTHVYKQSRIRRLTPIECCRLQTIEDDYFKDKNGNFVVSETQVYKCVGNGWTVAVISHIFNYLK